MSYADMAAKGPKQSNSEKVPDTVPEIAHSDSGVHSLDSLTNSVSSQQQSYANQQYAEEQAAQLRREGKREADKAAQQVQEFTAQAEDELQRLEKEAGKKYSEWSQEAKQSYEAWKKQAAKDFEKMKKEASKDSQYAKEEARKAGQWAEENKGNPVVIGNAVAITAVGALLGVGAYRLHQQNELTWKVAGAWAGVVGLFAVGDYYVSQYFFKKYPPKE